MIIKTEIDHQKLTKFNKNHPNGNIFQTTEMFMVYEKN